MMDFTKKRICTLCQHIPIEWFSTALWPFDILEIWYSIIIDYFCMRYFWATTCLNLVTFYGKLHWQEEIKFIVINYYLVKSRFLNGCRNNHVNNKANGSAVVVHLRSIRLRKSKHFAKVFERIYLSHATEQMILSHMRRTLFFFLV
jgi:hypothetical protein